MSNEFKTSFAPIADSRTRVLILGSLPGEMSLALRQYYAHPRNRFWPLVAALTAGELPAGYADRLKMLRRHRIGLWDVVAHARRVGSLDIRIVEETPNELPGFIAEHPALRTIAFNGARARTLFDKYFSRLPDIEYLALPSTSPANAAFSFERLFEAWRVIPDAGRSQRD